MGRTHSMVRSDTVVRGQADVAVYEAEHGAVFVAPGQRKSWWKVIEWGQATEVVSSIMRGPSLESADISSVSEATKSGCIVHNCHPWQYAATVS